VRVLYGILESLGKGGRGIITNQAGKHTPATCTPSPLRPRIDIYPAPRYFQVLGQELLARHAPEFRRETSTQMPHPLTLPVLSKIPEY
jgi:hypothetical protein